MTVTEAARTSDTGTNHRTARRSTGSGLTVVIAALGLLVAACASHSTASTAGAPTASPAAAAATGELLASASTPLGSILVDGQGRTVYMFAADSVGHATCTGQCLVYWPAVVAPASLPASLPGVTATLGAITRPDGTKQLTADGLPLYTFAGDKAPGQANGQGKNLSGGLWWVLSPSGAVVKAAAAPPAKASTSKAAGGGWA